MEPSMHDWGRLAEAIREARIRRGFAKRVAFARELGIDDSTMAIIEGRRTGRVSDEMLDFVTTRLGWTPGQWRAVLNGILTPVEEIEANSIVQVVRSQLNPRLSEFKEHELLDELRTRFLLAAAELGGDRLGWSTDATGDPEIVSHIVPKAG